MHKAAQFRIQFISVLSNGNRQKEEFQEGRKWKNGMAAAADAATVIVQSALFNEI